MVQWAPQESDRDYRMILRSFQSVFPHTTAWASGSILIGSNEPLLLDRPALERKLADPAWRPVLQHAGVTSWDGLAALFTGGSEQIRQVAAGAPLLTDDRPRLEYYRTLPPDDSGWSGSALPVGPIDQVLP